MTQCDHFIIACSIFSWWGAWLCINPNKLVIVPDPWFNPNYNRVKNNNTDDLIPPDWIRIKYLN
jgi:hypothetical protein